MISPPINKRQTPEALRKSAATNAQPAFVPDAAQGSRDGQPLRIALVNFLFNWPSSGGGIVHTVELAHFLHRAGYAVQHFYVRYAGWDIGKVEQPLPCDSQALNFEEASWQMPILQERLRGAVAAHAPDYVLLTDSWNIKPYLAEAVRAYPYFIRLQALECLCPLNNLRLLVDPDGKVRQCTTHQLADAGACLHCVRERGTSSGSLHRAERNFCGVGTVAYDRLLRRALHEAEAVLVLNPLAEALVAPYARRVLTVPWGMDPARFPWPWPEPSPPPGASRPLVIFQAGVIDEFIKGFHIVHEACARLWQQRQDFELVATGRPAGRVDAWTRFTGWMSQAELPRHYHAAAIVVVPALSQEGLSRTSVEAMAAGKPVVASRIGGLPSTVHDGRTGLLCRPGDPDHLAAQLSLLLDQAELRRQLGEAGRRCFEEAYRWEVVVERYYRPLFVQP